MTKFKQGEKVVYKGEVKTVKITKKDFGSKKISYRLEEGELLANEDELEKYMEVIEQEEGELSSDKIPKSKQEFAQDLIDEGHVEKLEEKEEEKPLKRKKNKRK